MLCILVNRLLALKKALISTPDLDGAKMSVHEKAEMYYQTTVKISTSLQAITARKQQDKDILEWIWPERQVYSLPKKPDEDNVENSGDWFLASHEYKQWVSQGSTTLICYGQRNFSQFP